MAEPSEALLMLPDVKAAHYRESKFELLHPRLLRKGHRDECERRVQISLGFLTSGNRWMVIDFSEIKDSEGAYFGEIIMCSL